MRATLQERIAQARHDLQSAGLSPDDAAIDADVLARHLLGWDRARLLSRGREAAPPDFDERFDALIARRMAHEPVAYITGHREFWDREFEVTPDVLIPRPETEIIVEAVLEERPAGAPRLLDVGTGSGCLAVTLAAELPAARVIASDVSAAALAVARRNARRHGVDRRVHFVRAACLQGLAGPFDLIVSNPPYVPATAELPRDVAGYEPAGALFAGDDGLGVLRVLIAETHRHLAPGGRFVVEFGLGQAGAIETLAATAAWNRVQIRSDLQGIPRTAILS